MLESPKRANSNNKRQIHYNKPANSINHHRMANDQIAITAIQNWQ